MFGLITTVRHRTFVHTLWRWPAAVLLALSSIPANAQEGASPLKGAAKSKRRFPPS
jgi:hypothetical protein